MYHPFSIAETTIAAWNIFRKNFITIIVYSVISFFLLFVFGLAVEFVIPADSFWSRMAGSFLDRDCEASGQKIEERGVERLRALP